MNQSLVLPKLMPREKVIARIVACLEALPLDRAFEVTWGEYRRKRSVQQCRYLNGVAYKILSDATGYERDDISEFMCGEYFGWREKRVPKSRDFPTGRKHVPVRTTTTDEHGKRDVLKWDAFSDYVAFIQRFAANKGIFIPDPDPEWWSRPEREAA